MRSGIFGGLGLIVLAVVAFVLYLSVFIIDPTQQVLVLRFGDPIRVLASPGLYFKVPLIDNVVYVEKQILDLDSPSLEVIASDQKRLVVDAFGRYRVTDPLLFYQTVTNQTVAESRLAVILNSAIRRVLGDASFLDVVRDKRASLMGQITQQVNTEGKSLGVQVVDVRIRRADLPQANSQAIYQRMQTERQRQAAEIRATGGQEAQRIQAEADRTATVIIADANKQSAQIHGDGDAERNRIFAAAYNRDPEFFAFFRSMQAYQTALGANSTRLVLSPDSEFFRYFSDSLGRTQPATAGAQPGAGGPQAADAGGSLPPAILLNPPQAPVPPPTAPAARPNVAPPSAPAGLPPKVDNGPAPAVGQ